MESKDDDSVATTSQFLGVSLGMFGRGMVGGVAYIFRQEKVKFDRHTHGRPALVAARALLYGTILACGTFGAGLGLFVKFTGITNVKQFGQVATALVRPLYQEPTGEQIATNNEEVTEIENMFDSYFKTDDKKSNNKNSSE